MGSKSSKRTESRSSIVPVEKGAIQESGGEIAGLPAGYGELLGEIKARIARSRIEAALAANHVLIDLYWHIGRSIDARLLSRLHRRGYNSVTTCDRIGGSGVPRALKIIPWGHNLELLFKLKDLKAGAFKPEDAGKMSSGSS